MNKVKFHILISSILIFPAMEIKAGTAATVHLAIQRPFKRKPEKLHSIGLYSDMLRN
jgi:hypothetical protein